MIMYLVVWFVKYLYLFCKEQLHSVILEVIKTKCFGDPKLLQLYHVHCYMLFIQCICIKIMAHSEICQFKSICMLTCWQIIFRQMLYMLNTIQLQHLVSTCISTTCTSYKLQRQVFVLQVFLKWYSIKHIYYQYIN